MSANRLTLVERRLRARAAAYQAAQPLRQPTAHR